MFDWWEVDAWKGTRSPFDSECAVSAGSGNSIARSFTEPIDFPRLINTVYDDSARIFIELGPRQTCSYFIGKILQDRPHATIPMNIKGSTDIKSIIRVIGRLVGHRVPLDLSVFFE